MELLIPISMNVLLVVITYLLDRYTKLKKLPYVPKQIVIGILFGAVSCYASLHGVEVFETMANVRDAAPLSAGLIFGAPAGIISGVIGGTFRWFSVYLTGGGYYTRVACSIATILAGIMAAILRKYMFENKKPLWSYAVVITILCEVVHMLLIFLTNMNDSVQAFELVRKATPPMVIGNVIAVSASLIIVGLLSKERVFFSKRSVHIAETFQHYLLVCIVFAYIVTSVFTFFLQDGMVQIETEEHFRSAITDVVADIKEKSDTSLLNIAKDVREEYQKDPTCSLSALASEYGVFEINVVKADGLIYKSTNMSYVEQNFNMFSSDQSAEFMQLVEKNTSYVQEYGPAGIDGKTMRKYAGVSLNNGRFIQVGYNADQFHDALDEFVIDVTKNRHIGTSGFIMVCDEAMQIISNDNLNGSHISAIGIDPNEDMLAGNSSKELETKILYNKEFDSSEKHIYAYTFVEGYCIVAALPSNEAMFMRDASLYTSVFMQVLIFATLLVFIYILIKRVIINNLKKINTSLEQITGGNLNVTVDVRSNKEFASLSDDINSTVTTLKRYIAEAAARIDKELEYAKQIQLSALPADFPNDDDCEICANMIAAKEVGGDFYDFYKLDDTTIAFLVADVSGKGIPAAMFMMTAKTILKDLAEGGMAVNDIFTKANEKLCENNESGMFVTAWMGILDLTTGKLQYANAGHNPPLIKRADGSFEYLRSRAGFILAGMEGFRYKVNELQLGRGDRLFLYTDGVSEATNTENQLYGEDRLLEFMNGSSTVGAKELLPALKANIDEFVGEAPQFDDITMLILDYKLKMEDNRMINKIYPAKVEALNDVIGFVEETLEGFECSMRNTMAVLVAIEEVFVNVASYAYGDEEGDVSFSIGFDEATRDVTFILADKGVPFDPLKKPDPDVTLAAEERQIGGLGIFITKKTMDSISYAYENGENILTMVKKI